MPNEERLSTHNVGNYIALTNVWDISSIYSTDINSDQFKELIVRLYQNVNNIATSLNLKDTGYYQPTEFMSGRLYFPNPIYNEKSKTTPVATPPYRPVYRQAYKFPALLNTGTASMLHGITMTAETHFTHIYGGASNPGIDFIPLPYSSAVAPVELWVDDTTIYVKTVTDYSAYTNVTVVLEYIKS